MIRTQIQLLDDQYERLRQRAAATHKSLAQQIRDALDLYLRTVSAPKDDLADIAGKFRPLPMKDLKDHDRWFAEAIMDSKRPSRAK